VAYQSLYRRYRPQRFADVRGQDHLVRGLQNAVRDDRVGHAYLFSGPRGTGKTSTARILAKVLNCAEPIDGEPCGVCESCVAIEQGASFDVHEMDAASNRRIDDIRDLIAKISLGTPGRTKVYILDEVHMLTAEASNALLKVLEEAPPHVVFVLATTDPQKVLPTIRSRCQHFDLHLLPADELTELARYIVDDAGLEVGEEAIEYAVRTGAGSARDMESALERVATAGVTPDDTDALDEVVEALCARDTGKALMAVDEAMARGRNPRALGEQLIGRLRDVFLAAVGADVSRLPSEERARVADQAGRLTAAGATRAMEVLGEAFVGIQDAPDQRIPLEVALVRLTRADAELSLAALADRVARLERSAPAAADAPGDAAAAPSARPDRSPEPAPAAGDAPAGPTAPPTGGLRPADEARQRLAEKKQRTASPAKKAPSARRPAPASGGTATTESTPGSASAGQATGGQPSSDQSSGNDASGGSDTTAAAASAGQATGTGSAGALPSRDELTLAWGDAVLGTLPPKAKTRFAGGRFVSVEDGAAVFGLPNKIHVTKCEEVRGMVENALAQHFGRPVPLRIVIDRGAPPPVVPGSDAPASDDGPHGDVEVIDLDELTDATDVAGSGVERVAQVFPGAELVEEE
jgi:DNA polymerase III subunit gamma/tau